MIVLETYQQYICLVDSLDCLYKDSNGIWRDSRKGPCDLVGVWVDKKSMLQPMQLSLFD